MADRPRRDPQPRPDVERHHDADAKINLPGRRLGDEGIDDEIDDRREIEGQQDIAEGDGDGITAAIKIGHPQTQRRAMRPDTLVSVMPLPRFHHASIPARSRYAFNSRGRCPICGVSGNRLWR